MKMTFQPKKRARDVPAMTVVGGVPAKVLRVVQEGKEERYETAV